jgi:hypothetical protein
MIAGCFSAASAAHKSGILFTQVKAYDTFMIAECIC